MSAVITSSQKQIITSPLDTDAYKFTMLLFIWMHWRGLQVKFALNNRSHAKFPLAKLVDKKRLEWELEACREAFRFSEMDADYIIALLAQYSSAAESEAFRYFLRSFRLSPITVEEADDTYHIVTEGLWPETTMWETPVLSIVSECVTKALAEGRGRSMDNVRKEAEERRNDKIVLLDRYPQLLFVEFGTRRRASKLIQGDALGDFHYAMPKQLVTSSNVYFARELLGRYAGGTMAHEPFMALAALLHLMYGRKAIRRSQMDVFDLWYQFYGGKLTVALNETFGSKAFFEDFGPERLRLWDGVRPDSGDPIEEGEKYIAELLRYGIDSKTKKLFLADGQTPESMVKCFLHFKDRINVVFGPGTNFTNDCGLPNLSLVMKLVEVMHQDKRQGTVKLSNNLRKAQGSPEDIAIYAQEFGYQATSNEECRY